MSNFQGVTVRDAPVAPSSGKLVFHVAHGNVTINAETKEITLHLDDLVTEDTGIEVVATHIAPDGETTALSLNLEALTRDPRISTAFDAPAKLDALGIVAGSATPTIAIEDRAARIKPADTGRLHTDFKPAGGDGLYRCLLSFDGAELAYSLDRRVGFAGRIRRVGSDYFGIRLEMFTTQAGDKRLHLREYTGSTGIATQLATVPGTWSFGTYYWLELEVVGENVRGRIYAEADEAPDWQIEAKTTQLDAGAFGPHAFAAAGAASTIDVKRIEFIPA